MVRLNIIGVSIVLLFTGCGNKVTVSGTVSYPDGSPLTMGIVYFEREQIQAFGIVDSSGKYQLGEVEAKEGIKPGEYRVRVIAKTGGTSDGAPLVYYVDRKYENIETSGLTCTVAGQTTHDIKVEKPR